MPKRKRGAVGPYGKRRRRFRKRYRRRTLGTRRLLRVLRVSIEKKRKETIATATPLNTAGTIVQLNDVAEGDTSITREGLKITGKYLFGRIFCEHNGSSTSYTNVRMIIFWDKQQVADTAPTMAGTASSSVLSTASSISPLSNTTKGRYTVIWDRHLTLVGSPADDAGGALGATKYYKLNINLRNVVTRFNGSASTDIQKNGLYLGLFSSASTNAPSITYNLRYNYIDL